MSLYMVDLLYVGSVSFKQLLPPIEQSPSTIAMMVPERAATLKLSRLYNVTWIIRKLEISWCLILTFVIFSRIRSMYVVDTIQGCGRMWPDKCIYVWMIA